MKTPGHWKTFSPRTLLYLPLSLLYWVGNLVDRETTTPVKAALPVISVGNVTAGGTGKTPVALALVPLLRDLGKVPHIITRGYRAQEPLKAHRVADTDTAEQVGDEALLLARTAPTWAGSDRLASIRAAKKAGGTLALCDDAHQHYRLKKDIAFLVIDGPYGFGNGQLIPAGPLREPLKFALPRADAVIIIGADKHLVAAQIFVPIFRAEIVPVMTAIDREKNYFAFAGIGRPEKFYDTLRSAGASVVGTRDFPDHHNYSDADIKALKSEARQMGATLITTEKDAVKLPGLQGEMAVLPITVEFADIHALHNFLKSRIA